VTSKRSQGLGAGPACPLHISRTVYPAAFSFSSDSASTGSGRATTTAAADDDDDNAIVNADAEVCHVRAPRAVTSVPRLDPPLHPDRH
jgi:hypothetical protein